MTMAVIIVIVVQVVVVIVGLVVACPGWRHSWLDRM